MEIETLWTQYRTSLKAFLHAKISDPAEVEDLLREILIKTHHNLPTIRNDTSVKAWLCQVANRTIIDFYRERARTQDLAAEDLWYGEDDPSDQQALSRCIRPFIHALPATWPGPR